jgi:ketosteroid isomerase-like protein
MERTRTAKELVSEIVALYRARRTSEVRGLYHPDARLRTHVGGTEWRPVDETVAALEAAAGDALFQATLSEEVHALDDHAAVNGGSVRYRVESGHAMQSLVWLYTQREGRIVRVMVFANEAEARDRYRRHGVDLGF